MKGQPPASSAPRSHWRKIYGLFDPARKLEGDTLQYFVARDRSLPDRIEMELSFSASKFQALFVGQRGSGKSSELRRLANKLDHQFLTILIDVDELTDIFSVSHVEVLYLMGATIYAAARVAGADIEQSFLEDLVQSIETVVRSQTAHRDFKLDAQSILGALTTAGTAAAAAGSMGAGAAAAAAFVVTAVSLFKDLKFSLGVDETLVRKLEVKPQIAEIVRALNAIISRVEDVSGRSLLVIVDGLDRVEFEQGRAVFAESQILSRPDCHLIYVIPSHLYYSPHLSQAKQIFQKVYLLPNVKLHLKDSSERAAMGYDILREVIDQRLASIQLARGGFFAEEALDLLIEASGGLMREFIRLVQSAVLKAATTASQRVEHRHAEDAVDELRRDYMAGVTPRLVAELVGVAETGLPSGSEEANMLLQNLYILCQSNKDIWYEVHPVLTAYVKKERQRAEAKNASLPSGTAE